MNAPGSDSGTVYHEDDADAHRDAAPQSGGKLQHYRKRISDLRDVIEDATAEREFAMFRAHQHGMPAEQIADVALVDVSEVHSAVAVLSKEEGIDEWGDGPTWIRCPSRAW